MGGVGDNSDFHRAPSADIRRIDIQADYDGLQSTECRRGAVQGHDYNSVYMHDHEYTAPAPEAKRREAAEAACYVYTVAAGAGPGGVRRFDSRDRRADTADVRQVHAFSGNGKDKAWRYVKLI